MYPHLFCFCSSVNYTQFRVYKQSWRENEADVYLSVVEYEAYEAYENEAAIEFLYTGTVYTVACKNIFPL